MMKITKKIFSKKNRRKNSDRITQGKQHKRPVWNIQDLMFKHLDIGSVLVGNANNIDQRSKKESQPSVLGRRSGTIKFCEIGGRISAEINRIHNPKRPLPPDGLIPVAVEGLTIGSSDGDFLKLAFDNGSIHHHHNGRNKGRTKKRGSNFIQWHCFFLIIHFVLKMIRSPMTCYH